MRKLPQMNVTVTKLLLTKIDRERDRQWARGRKVNRSEAVRYILSKGLAALEGGRD